MSESQRIHCEQCGGDHLTEACRGRQVAGQFELYLKGQREADPVKFICETREMGAKMEDYEKMIPKAEQRALGNIELLEKYALLLRGDCLQPEIAAKIETAFKDKVTGAVCNLPFPLSGEKEKLYALGTLLAVIVRRYMVARNYEAHHQGKGKLDEVPCIIYGFWKHGKNSFWDDAATKERETKAIKQKDWIEYWRGATDDKGISWENIHALPLPPAPKGAKMIKSGDPEDIFPPVHTDEKELYQASQADISRAFRFASKPYDSPDNSDPFKHFEPGQSLVIGNHFLRPDTYFHALLCADKMLSEIEKFDLDKNK